MGWAVTSGCASQALLLDDQAGMPPGLRRDA